MRDTAHQMPAAMENPVAVGGIQRRGANTNAEKVEDQLRNQRHDDPGEIQVPLFDFGETRTLEAEET